MPIPLVQRVPYLLDRARGRRVLHLGCTNAPYTATSLADGSLLHLRLAEVASELHGVDIDKAGLDVLSARGVSHLHHGTLDALVPVLAPLEFDVVIAGEIVEHLPNPGGLLTSVARVMGPSTALIITTINAYCAFRFAQFALRGRGGHAEPVHPEHVAYYSRATLQRLVMMSGLDVIHTAYYDLGVEHRPYLWRSLRAVNRVAVAFAPQLADGVIVECQRPSATPVR